jgi:DNA-binding NarL/FixJ family response regulator
MSNSPLQILFLGEDSAWATLTRALSAAQHASLKIHRTQSLNELFLVLAGGRWHAVALDVQAWNFQGLHYVDKIRSEYPAFPILALYRSGVRDLENKAKNVGASQCLALESLSADSLSSALLSILADRKSDSYLRKESAVQLTFNLPSDHALPSSTRTLAISHALNNLLCVITANADLLAEHINGSSRGVHSLSEIKRAAKSASDLMRQLK